MTNIRSFGVAIALCLGVLSVEARALDLTYTGVVEASTAALASLTPPGTAVGGPISYDDAAVASGTVGPAGIESIDVNVGGFCFTTGPDSTGCPSGGAHVPIETIDMASITFAAGEPTGGLLNVTAFSPSFMVSIPISFDLTAGTFFADAGALGTASGTFAPPEIGFSTTSIVFPDVEPGGSTEQTLTITNAGATPLTLTGIGTADPAAAPFSIVIPASGGCDLTAGPLQLAAGGSCNVTVRFAPTMGGSFADTFSVSSNNRSSPQSISMSGDAPVPNIVVTPTTVSITTLVDVPASRRITVRNSGDAALVIGTIAAPAAPFGLSGDNCSSRTLATDETCTFDITFVSSTADTAFMTTVNVPSNDPDTASVAVDVSAIANTLRVAEIEVDPRALEFPEVLIGDAAVSNELTIRNTGNADLEIVGFEFTRPLDYEAVSSCPAMIPEGESCTVAISFGPDGTSPERNRDATLTILSNASTEPAVDVALTATAFDGPRIEVDPVALVFGLSSAPVDPGDSVTATTQISNTGNAPLDITNIVFVDDEGEFSIPEGGNCVGTILRDESCTLTVEFAPVIEFDQEATMDIESSDADAPTVTVTLQGFVFRGPRIGAPAAEVDVDGGTTVEVGESIAADITIVSTGTEPLEITSITHTEAVEGEDNFSLEENCTAAPVPNGESCTITVTFAPESPGTKRATITIESNDVTVAARRGPTTTIAISGTAVAPPSAPPAPRTDPPPFATQDVGGVGSAGLWLLAVAGGLVAIRRRRLAFTGTQEGSMPQQLHQSGSTAVLAAVVSLAAPQAANAISFENESGNIQGSWDTTISYGLAYRLQAPADNLIGTINGGSKFSVNGDDGTLNFSRGIYSNAIKLTSELEINYAPWNIGLFVRGNYFYDYELEEEDRKRTPLPQASLDRAGSDGDVLDAFISWKFDIGERPAELRIGEQVVNWGESTFIQGGANVINHINVPALRLPGSELRDALLPQDLAFFSIGLTPNIDLELVYQYDWDDTEPDPVGTFFSTNDFAVDGGTAVRLGFGDTPDFPNPSFAFYPFERPFNAIPRGPTRWPSDDGQWGWAVRLFAPDFNNGTEFGFYYYNYHSRLPLISARTGTVEGLSVAAAIGASAGFGGASDIAFAAGSYLAANPGDFTGALDAGVAAANPGVPAYAARGIANAAITGGDVTVTATAYATDAFAYTPSTGLDPFMTPPGETAEFFTSYPEDIQMYAFSWNTTLGETAWQGEIAHHRNRPLQVDDLELLFAGLSPLRAQFAQFGQLGSFSFNSASPQFNPDAPPLTVINGFYRRDYTQANMAFTRLFGPMLGADQGVLLFEVAYHHVHGFPSKDVLRFDGPATVVSGNDRIIDDMGTTLAEFAHRGKPSEPADNFPDANSWGYRLAGRLDFSNFIGSFNMSPRFAWQHDVSGITPGPAGAFLEDRKAITLGTAWSYQNRWEFDLSYSRFFGGGKQNEIHDRDFMAGSIKFTF